MKKPTNPFFFRELPLDAPFCDRTGELKELASFARSSAAVVLYSPRRYGKTSLIKRVQSALQREGFLPIYTDFFGVTDADEVARRLAWGVYEQVRTRQSLFRKAMRIIRSFRPVLKPDENGNIALSLELVGHSSGLALLEETLRSLETAMRDLGVRPNLVMDEFQEISELKEDLQIEGIMRQHVQRMKASFFFVGSRRRLLLEMFNDRKRPFYQSAINYELTPIDAGDFEPFLQKLFASCGVHCSSQSLQELLSLTHGHPYYTQKLCFLLYETAGKRIGRKQVESGLQALLNGERPVFESILQGLAPRQVALLRALAEESSESVFAASYISAHHLGSSGAVQGALKRLTALDLIEKDRNTGKWVVTDPIFRRWLVAMKV